MGRRHQHEKVHSTTQYNLELEASSLRTRFLRPGTALSAGRRRDALTAADMALSRQMAFPGRGRLLEVVKSLWDHVEDLEKSGRPHVGVSMAELAASWFLAPFRRQWPGGPGVPLEPMKALPGFESPIVAMSSALEVACPDLRDGAVPDMDVQL